MKIDNACGMKSLGVFVCADENDPASLYRDSFRSRLLCVYGVDVSVTKNKIDVHSTSLHFNRDRFVRPDGCNVERSNNKENRPPPI